MEEQNTRHWLFQLQKQRIVESHECPFATLLLTHTLSSESYSLSVAPLLPFLEESRTVAGEVPWSTYPPPSLV